MKVCSSLRIMSALLPGVLFCLSMLRGQSQSEIYSQYGTIRKVSLKSAPFPHPRRAQGYTYRDQLFAAEQHYQDSSVAIFIPNYFRPGKRVDFVVHFHGWNASIDSVLKRFRLIEQLSGSRKNAILIVPQGPKNAPDSFGGKLEDPDGFKSFMEEIVLYLRAEQLLGKSRIGNIILSGHSGGYHVIASILNCGGLTGNIKEVHLYDGLYGEIEKYVQWIEHYNGKFIHIFTTNGGTKENSIALMDSMKCWQMPFCYTMEDELSQAMLMDNRIIFIFSNLRHSEVISVKDEYERFLSASQYLKTVRMRE